MNVSAPAMLRASDIDTQTVTALIAGALRRAFGNDKSAVKRTAEVARSGPRAAENWLSGRNAPDVVHFLRLAAELPELQELLRQLLGWQANLDPELQRDLHALFTTLERINAFDQRAAAVDDFQAARAKATKLGPAVARPADAPVSPMASGPAPGARGGLAAAADRPGRRPGR